MKIKQESPLYKLKNKKILLKMINYNQNNVKNINESTDNLFVKKYINKETKKITSKDDENKRTIFTHNKNSYAKYLEFMKSMKNLDRLMKKSLDFSDSKYVQSTIKKTSNIRNAKLHVRSNYFLLIDLKDFFNNVNVFHIKTELENVFGWSNDLAAMVATMSTLKLKNKRSLPQGFPTSPLLALLYADKAFKEIDVICKIHGLIFSVYVDDITISSKNFISKHILDKIFGILSKYGLKIHTKDKKKAKVRKISLREKLLITGIAFKSDKIFPYYKADMFNQKNYIQKMKTLLSAIAKYHDKELNYGIVSTLFESNGDKGSLVKKYQGYFLYTSEAYKIVPKDYNSRSYRYWIKKKEFYRKQYETLSELKNILHKRFYELSPDEINLIKKVCSSINNALF